MGTRVSAEAAAIAREAQMRSEASEAARIAYVTQARTLRERRGSYIKMVIISALVAVICSRLRGTVGALGFSISTGLVIWGVVDAVMLTNQIRCSTSARWIWCAPATLPPRSLPRHKNCNDAGFDGKV